MIPYVALDVIDLGLFKIHFWGLMVALGFLAAIFASLKFAEKNNFSKDHVYNLAPWVIIGAMIMGRIVHVFIYEWGYYSQHLGEIIKIWQGGLSSFGGFIGALMVFLFYIKIKKIDFLQFADVLVFGLPLGLFVGRIGCAFIHDHPGIPTSFWLGVKYPDMVRHDLGLYLSLNGLMIFLVFVYFYRKNKQYWNGFYFCLFLFIYGLDRFALDFLRVWNVAGADKRFFYLTFAQYGALAFVGASLYTYLHKRKWDL